MFSSKPKPLQELDPPNTRSVRMFTTGRVMVLMASLIVGTAAISGPVQSKPPAQGSVEARPLQAGRLGDDTDGPLYALHAGQLYVQGGSGPDGPQGDALSGASRPLNSERFYQIQRPVVQTRRQSDVVYQIQRPVVQPAQNYIQRIVTLPGEDPTLGLALVPADAGLRAQLGIEEGRGLVAASVHPGYPAERAGLKQDDILLTLEDQPLEKAEDFPARLKEVGERAVELALIRGGERTTLTVTPRFRVSLSPTEPPAPEAAAPAEPTYYLGVGVSPADATLRSHLGEALPEGRGLVVTEVVPDSPAAKADLRAGDVLISFGEDGLSDLDSLVKAVRSRRDREAKIVYLRGGRPREISIAAAPRPQPESTSAAPGQGGATHSNEFTYSWVNDLNLLGRNPAAVDMPQGVVWGYTEVAPPHPQNLEGSGSLVYFLGRGSQVASGQKSSAERPGFAGGAENPDGSADARIEELTARIAELNRAVEALRVAVDRQQPDKPEGR